MNKDKQQLTIRELLDAVLFKCEDEANEYLNGTGLSIKVDEDGEAIVFLNGMQYAHLDRITSYADGPKLAYKCNIEIEPHTAYDVAMSGLFE